jgi:hypothetical protein
MDYYKVFNNVLHFSLIYLSEIQKYILNSAEKVDGKIPPKIYNSIIEIPSNPPNSQWVTCLIYKKLPPEVD